MSAPKVTLLTAVRNGARTSARRSTASGDRLSRIGNTLIVDDASTDQTVGIVAEFSAKIRESVWSRAPFLGDPTSPPMRACASLAANISFAPTATYSPPPAHPEATRLLSRPIRSSVPAFPTGSI